MDDAEGMAQPRKNLQASEESATAENEISYSSLKQK
jgi:hypothetical protein